MQFIPKNVKKFQAGGEIAPEEEVPQEEVPQEEQPTPEEGGGEQDPLMMIAQAAAQALQNQDCQTALQVCQAFIQLIQQQGGGQQPEQPQGEPVFRKGGVLVRRIKK
jgi:hypothetical protein